MIRIVLLGRTGNNLFQYALGRVLAEKHGVPLVLDACWFDAAGWQEVSHFLKLPIRAAVTRKWHLPARALRKLTGKHRWQYYGRFPFLSEKPGDHAFDPSFLDAPSDCALFGYFQSWRYFAAMENELRSELAHLLETSCPQPAAISGPTSVAVHVRRGDFLDHPAFQVCGIAYYQHAMEQMRERLGSPQFSIFSDDPEWCLQAFSARDVTIIDSGPAAANPLHDLHLMSTASHHIIANSSYSWWAAWIGKKPGQQVILPDRWFANGVNAPIAEKTCENWQILPTGDPEASYESV